MRFDIVKCHGSGNDFALIDARAIHLTDDAWAGVARALSDRAGPVGSDGLLLLGEGVRIHDFSMRMFNSDGSESEQCLNGLRCVARLGFERLGVARANVKLKTSSAEVAVADPLAAGVYTVRETAGPVELDAARWLKDGGHEHVERRIAGLPSDRRYVAVGIGNPHLIAFVEAIDDAELSAVGAFAEGAPPLLPERANVSFVEIHGAAELFVRTHERGVGLTDSCGSAMAAATFAACLTGRCAFGSETTVLNRGGRVVAQADSEGMVTLHGNATFEWEGSVAIDPATGMAGELIVARHHDAEIAAWAAVADA
ncbi:MAG: diaminopimelate epimerase [Pseudomonadota bacterium]